MGTDYYIYSNIKCELVESNNMASYIDVSSQIQ